MSDTPVPGRYVNPSGEFTRDQRYITTRITADGRTGFPVEPGRYRLVASRACPWANRATIARRLLGLEDVLSLGMTGPVHDARSWTFDLDPGAGSCPGHRAAARGLHRPDPRLRPRHHRPRHRGHPHRPGRDQRLLYVPRTSSMSCDQAIFVDHAVDTGQPS